MLHMPCSMLFESAVAKTYAEFQAHIATLTGSTRAWQTNASIAPGAFRTTANNASLSSAAMGGTSWASNYTNGSAPARLLQHGFKDQPTWQAQRDAGLEIYVEITSIGSGVATGLSRNGYTSLDDFSGTAALRQLKKIIRWDSTLNKAFQSDPSVGGDETEYTWS
ncbi:hypothetical protein [Brevundimonas vesicularis]|uniref:hypothetical protein n=1 Tax=Brevundimonas vesicularis TaxID=41276 RepID=UPI0028A861B7|nr:hypothetical protein [Brevundimonas vesicularis]